MTIVLVLIAVFAALCFVAFVALTVIVVVGFFQERSARREIELLDAPTHAYHAHLERENIEQVREDERVAVRRLSESNGRKP